MEASWPEDRAPGDVLGSILYFLEIQGETELFGFLLFLFFIGNLDAKIIVLILRLRWAPGAR